jgi:hypothetical protein
VRGEKDRVRPIVQRWGCKVDAENAQVLHSFSETTRAWHHQAAIEYFMPRKVVFSICAVFLLLSFCLVDAKKKKNVRASHFLACCRFCLFTHASSL